MSFRKIVQGLSNIWRYLVTRAWTEFRTHVANSGASHVALHTWSTGNGLWAV